MRNILKNTQPAITEFTLYVMSGVLSALIDFGIYFLLLQLHIWYVTASLTGNILGFIGAFLVQKYVVFNKKHSTIKHFFRYCVINLIDAGVTTALLILFVAEFHWDEGLSKILSAGTVVFWNFFLYKFLVYV